eukprot:scaffold2359_cov100-Pinguiococcus_pyrenoidosus.AAC.1
MQLLLGKTARHAAVGGKPGSRAAAKLADLEGRRHLWRGKEEKPRGEARRRRGRAASACGASDAATSVRACLAFQIIFNFSTIRTITITNFTIYVLKHSWSTSRFELTNADCTNQGGFCDGVEIFR